MRTLAHEFLNFWHTCDNLCDRFRGGIGSDFIGIYNIFHLRILEFYNYLLIK